MLCIPLEPPEMNGSTGWNPLSICFAAKNAVETGSGHLLASSPSAYVSKNCRETEAGKKSPSLLLWLSNTFQVTLTYVELAVPTFEF